jgi:hypothetical protein
VRFNDRRYRAHRSISFSYGKGHVLPMISFSV